MTVDETGFDKLSMTNKLSMTMECVSRAIAGGALVLLCHPERLLCHPERSLT